MRLPRVFSPQMHRRVDLVALPSVIASVVWMSRRNGRVAALMSMIAAGEGAALLTTDYPPGFLRWMSFRDHVWAATLHGILAGSMALLVTGISPRDRRILLALASMPIILSALSDTREQ
jgi:ABC-type Fe3+ transport system permease subunit